MSGHPHAAASLDPAKLTELQRRDRTETKGELDGTEYKVSRAFNPDAPRYPQVESHLWGAWPVLAIETGGYADFEVQDPYSGRSLWAKCFDGDNPYDSLRKLIDIMEAVDFLPKDADTV